MLEFLVWLSVLPLLLIGGQFLLYQSLMLVIIISQGFFKKYPKEYISDKKIDKLPNICILVPIHNEINNIDKKLDNIFSLDYPKELIRIVIVDDASDDGSALHAIEYAKIKNRNLELIQLKQRIGKIKALGLVRSTIKEELVLISDASVTTDPLSLRNLLKSFEDPKVAAATGRIKLVQENKNLIYDAHYILFELQNFNKFAESLLDSASGLYGQFFLLRNSLLQQLDLQAIYEDRHWALQIRELGYKVRLEPQVIINYEAPNTLRAFIKQKKRNIQALTESTYKHRHLLFNPRFGWFGLIIAPEYTFWRIAKPLFFFLSIFAAGLLYFSYDLPILITPFLYSFIFTILCILLGLLAVNGAPWQPQIKLTQIAKSLLLFLLLGIMIGKGFLLFPWQKSSPWWNKNCGSTTGK